MQPHPLVLDVIEVSRTRVRHRTVATYAVDLRGIRWCGGEVTDASLTVSSADTGEVRIAPEGARRPYGVSAPTQSLPWRQVELNAAARRDLEHAAGGFFMVEAEMPARGSAGVAPRVGQLVVRLRRRGASIVVSLPQVAA